MLTWAWTEGCLSCSKTACAHDEWSVDFAWSVIRDLAFFHAENPVSTHAFFEVISCDVRLVTNLSAIARQHVLQTAQFFSFRESQENSIVHLEKNLYKIDV